MSKVAKILIVLGLLVALFFLWRSTTYFANDVVPDTGLVAGTATSSVPTADILPTKLIIPKLNIESDVQRLGVTKTGNMAAPNNFTDVSWYKFGTVPGFKGSAVMSGHEDNAISLDGVFKHLEDLQIGDDVYVVREDGQKLRFKVVDKKILPYNLSGVELEKIFNAKDKAYLNLITCAGDWLASAKTNDQRLVIYTELVK